MDILKLKNVVKIYKMAGGGTFEALKNINATFSAGELVSIVGESGSGKSTLMNLIGGLDSDFEGEISYRGKNLRDYTAQELADYHKKSIGFIFQNFNLIPHLNLVDNVALAMTLSNVAKETRVKRAKELLEKVGLKDHLYKKPDQISGGQKQRVAIARALINDPDVIIADEPTGALDAETTDNVLALIKEIAQSGKLVLMVTHSDRVAAHCTRVLRIDNGELVSDEVTGKLEPLATKTEHDAIKVKNMSLFNAIRLAFLNMKAKLGRNTLVAFGTSIGIMAVVLMLSIGRGVTTYIKDTMNSYTNPNVTEVHRQSMMPDPDKQPAMDDHAEISRMQQNNMAALTGSGTDNDFTEKDITKLKAIGHVDRLEKGYSTLSLGTNSVSYGDKNATIMTLQTMSSNITKSSIVSGKAPGKDEVLLDKGTADLLAKNIVGKEVMFKLTIDGKQVEQKLKVSGTYEQQGSNFSTAIVRYSDLKDIFAQNGQTLKPNVVYLYTKNKDNTEKIKDEVKKLGFSGSMQETMTEMFTQMMDVISYVLAAIAAVSLVVSAIMILVVLNISVVERTKEIGVLKALGARRKDIRRIFVSEAFLIGLSSGILGVVLTWILQVLVNHFTVAQFEVPVVMMTTSYILTGIVISVIISMLAGLLPADRASKLDPVEALRKE